MIAVEGVRKRFGPHVAVDGLSLHVDAGEVVALLGPNGCGKTTTLKALVGLVRPDAGTLRWHGKPMPWGTLELRRNISYLPQRLGFPTGMTGREVLALYAGLRGCAPSRIGEVLAMTALELDARKTVDSYSGGMVQRLGLAIARLPDASLLVLDEPTAALDPDGVRIVREFITAERTRGRGILFSTHRLADAEGVADRILILSNGRLVRETTIAELSERASAASL